MTLDERHLHQLQHGLPASADYCEVSTATRLLGDRWSLLVVRELFVGNTRFTEIQEALPGLSRGLLASRLGYLTRLGIVERRVADGSDLRVKHFYALTDSGEALGPVLTALGEWAAHWGPPKGPTVSGVALLDLDQLRGSFDPSALPAERMQIQFLLSDSDAAWLRADRTGVRACRGVNDGDSDLVVRTSLATLSQLYWGQSTCRGAIARREIAFDGPISTVQAFSEWFPNRPAVSGVESGLASVPEVSERVQILNYPPQAWRGLHSNMTSIDSPGVPITLIGGPTTLIEYAGLRILTDPTFDEPQSYGEDVTGYEGFTLVKTESPAMTVEEVGKIDVVLASHEHFDNLDLLGRQFAARVGHVYTTDEVAGIVQGAESLAEWESRQVTSPTGQVVTFTAVPAHHGPDGIWQAIGPVLGFVIECPGEKTIYFSGDNSDVDVVRDVAVRYPNIEIAILNVGGPKFVEMLGDHYITFSDETATDATEVLANATIIPVHADSWGHFTQTTTSMKKVATMRGFSDRVVALVPGQSTTA